jgi:glycogen debranching enzyme
MLNGLLEASTFIELNRLPEPFCGFHRRSDLEGPTFYPVACSPQAWAAGSPYLLLQACLGVAIEPVEHVVPLSSPQLPDAIDQREVNNLRVGDLSIELRLRRNGPEIVLDVLLTG